MGLFKRLFGKEDADWQSATTPAPTAPTVSVPPVATSNVQTMTLTGNEAREALQGIERMTGMDLDGDGKVAGGAPPAGPPLSSIFTATGQPPAGDVVSQLERLAKLRESGALTEAEFAAEKAKLISGS